MSRSGATLIGILGLALGLRLWGIGFSLPEFVSHPDEAHYVPVAARMTARDPNPRYFENPPLFTYLLFVERKVATGLGLLETRDPEVLLASGVLHRMARATSAVAGALTVIPTFYLARRLGVRWPALAAGFLAVSFLHARDSHYGVNDVFMVLLLTCASLALSTYALGGGVGVLLVGGWLGGLATAAKYSAGLLLALVALAALVRREPGGRARSAGGTLLLAVGAFALGYLSGNPYTLLDWARFSADFSLLRVFGAHPWPGQPEAPVPVLYLRVLWIGAGPGMLLLSALGVASLARRRPAFWLLLFFPALYLAVMSTQALFFARFALPLFPFLAVLAAEGAHGLSGRLAGGRLSRFGPLVTAAAVLLASIPPLAGTVRHDVLLGRTDTRLLAREYVGSHLAPGTVVLTEGVSPPLPFSLVEVHSLKDVPLQWDELLDRGVSVFVAQSFVEEVFRTDARYVGFYARLRREAPLLAEFHPDPRGTPVRAWVDEQIMGPIVALWAIERPGPSVRIYRVGPLVLRSSFDDGPVGSRPVGLSSRGVGPGSGAPPR